MSRNGTFAVGDRIAMRGTPRYGTVQHVYDTMGDGRYGVYLDSGHAAIMPGILLEKNDGAAPVLALDGMDAAGRNAPALRLCTSGVLAAPMIMVGDQWRYLTDDDVDRLVSAAALLQALRSHTLDWTRLEETAGVPSNALA